MLFIVGLGPGSSDYILPKAVQVLKDSDVILGFERALKSIDFDYEKKKIVKSLAEVISYAEENMDKYISIVASGDPSFYGITDFINRSYSGNVEVVPGISSFQYLISKLNKSWQGSYLSSLHGREEDFIQRVKENNTSIWLTDKKNTPQVICKSLSDSNIKTMVYIGENLSYPDEKITVGMPEEFIDTKFSDLCVVIIERL
ncbi:precorrin-6y C5,15-methyltransferase (decarboxylating) subunit CbiE [Clostridium sp.]|uniref:precorrin-6y C5,15-methyltransferase (decarboxylating) subunit CbiE n=1 Tax=Clostridium sp. TaxID=1506 RepID=UPI003D6C79B3